MSSKRLQAEIEKCLRECQGHLQIYDKKWLELKCYNEAVASNDWRRLGELRHTAPPLCQFSCLQHIPGHVAESSHLLPAGVLQLVGSARSDEEFVSVDISCMQEREVSEVREKLRAELETLMKKVYRCRQQIIEWLHSSGDAPLRQTCFSREQLLEVKKEIETRSRRGRVFYLRGSSSEDTQNEEVGELQEALIWIQEYIDKLQENIDLYTATVERIACQLADPQSVTEADPSIFGEQFAQLSFPERLEAISCAVDACTAHSEYLDSILNKLRNNSFFASATDLPAEERARVHFLSICLHDIRKQLQQYVQPPHDPLIQVSTDIYQRLLQSPSTNGFLTPPRKTTHGATAATNTASSASQQHPPTQTSQTKSPAPHSTPEPTSNSRRSAEDSTELRATPPPPSAAHAIAGPSPGSEPCRAPIVQSARDDEGASRGEGGGRNSQELLKRRLQSLPLWRRPAWADKLLFSAGVCARLDSLESYAGMNSDGERKQAIDQLEKALHQHQSISTNKDCLPVLIPAHSTELPTVTTVTSWSGELYDGKKVLGDKQSLLCFDGHTRIETVCRNGTWTYGRIHGQPNSHPGWFPTAYAR